MTEPAKKAKIEERAPVTLGYWKIQGLGQPIRLLLEYAGIPYEEKVSHCVEKADGSFDKSSWFDEKFKIGLPFPNLPYLIDGELKLTQTIAILQHLADEAGLAGKSPEERASATMLFGLSQDVRKQYTNAAYNPRFDDMRDGLVDHLKSTALPELEAYVGATPHGGKAKRSSGNGLHLVGGAMTYVDLLWFDLLAQFLKIEPTVLDNLPNLKEIHATVLGTPSIAAYLASPKYVTQMNNTQAFFK